MTSKHSHSRRGILLQSSPWSVIACHTRSFVANMRSCACCRTKNEQRASMFFEFSPVASLLAAEICWRLFSFTGGACFEGEPVVLIEMSGWFSSRCHVLSRYCEFITKVWAGGFADRKKSTTSVAGVGSSSSTQEAWKVWTSCKN